MGKFPGCVNTLCELFSMPREIYFVDGIAKGKVELEV